MTTPSQRGFTLIELMISLVLGLIVIGGVISVLLSNQQSYRTNQALSQVQDASRIAFEFLARDIREAGGTGCGITTRVANVLNNGPTGGGTDWWANWANALVGYANDDSAAPVATGTSPTSRSKNTNSITIMKAGDSGVSVVSQQTNAANFQVNTTGNQIADDAIILVCDPNQATILQVNKGNASNVTVEYNTGSGSPGNCSKGLGYPTDCSNTNGNAYAYGANSLIATLSADYWYIGNNTLGKCITGDASGTAQACSLYRLAVVNGVPTNQEIVRNVTNLQIQYLQAGTFVPAGSVTDWSGITAAQVTLTIAVPTNPNNTASPDLIQRSFTNTITIRNRAG